MDNITLAHTAEWSVAEALGIHHPFFTINTTTVTNTWLVLAILLCIGIIVRIVLARPSANSIKIGTLLGTELLRDLAQQSLGEIWYKHVYFIGALFIFIFTCNIVSLLPYAEEPTTDINTTLALGLIAFLYVQSSKIRQDGTWEYIKGYFKPFFIMMPLEVVGKISNIVSISFRLFGNIFGGSIILRLYLGVIQGRLIPELFGLLSGLNMILVLFFVLFEGALQAFVFTVLTLTYLSMALQEEGH